MRDVFGSCDAIDGWTVSVWRKDGCVRVVARGKGAW